MVADVPRTLSLQWMFSQQGAAEGPSPVPLRTATPSVVSAGDQPRQAALRLKAPLSNRSAEPEPAPAAPSDVAVDDTDEEAKEHIRRNLVTIASGVDKLFWAEQAKRVREQTFHLTVCSARPLSAVRRRSRP